MFSLTSAGLLFKGPADGDPLRRDEAFVELVLAELAGRDGVDCRKDKLGGRIYSLASKRYD